MMDACSRAMVNLVIVERYYLSVQKITEDQLDFERISDGLNDFS